MDDQKKKPVLFYDGDCDFCVRCAEWLRKHGGAAVELKSVQCAFDEGDARVQAFKRETLLEVIHLVDGERVLIGAGAILFAISTRPWGGVIWWAYQHVPLFAPLAEWVYRRIASNRKRF